MDEDKPPAQSTPYGSQRRVDRAAKGTPAPVAARHEHYAQVAAVLPMLQQAGVTIMVGTDAGFLNSSMR